MRAILLGLVGVALASGVAGAGDSETQKRIEVLPYIRAASDCVAKEVVQENDAKAALQSLDIEFSSLSSNPLSRCGFTIKDMIYAHERIYGAGTGETFYAGPYKQDVKRAVLSRMSEKRASPPVEYAAIQNDIRSSHCPLDGLELVAKGLPDLEGKRFRITKIESHFNRLKSPRVNDWKNDGYVIALIEGEPGKFILSETYSGFGFPADYGRLTPATNKSIRKIRANRRSVAGERTRVSGVFYIFGDYEGLSFYPSACR